ncbi:MAG: dTDP-4-dehydrorhamnose reductase [Pseudomonadota bacterium]
MAERLGKLLVFGRTGQVARELARRAPDAVFAGRQDADLAHPERCAALIRAQRPAAVINAAAWTAVDAAEENRDAAFAVNAAAPGAMAAAAAELGIPFVHISTDYVFDGSGEAPFHPDATTAPLGVYGASKLAGEDAVRAAGGTHVILRTSWVFSAHGENFVKTMLSLAQTRETLGIVADQTGGPTPAADIASACLEIASSLARRPDLSGVYHFAGAPVTSWAGFARAIFQASGRPMTVSDIETADYPTPAARPLNSRLDCARTEAAFGIKPPDWRAGLQSVLSELGAVAN